MIALILLFALLIALTIAWLIAEWRADQAYMKRWRSPVKGQTDRLPPL